MPCCSCAVFDVPKRPAGVSGSLRLASRSWMFLFSSVYFGMNLLNIVVSMLFFLMVSSRHVGFCSWLHCFSAELLILLPCNNESYLLQIQKMACFLSFFSPFLTFRIFSDTSNISRAHILTYK